MSCRMLTRSVLEGLSGWDLEGNITPVIREQWLYHEYRDYRLSPTPKIVPLLSSLPVPSMQGRQVPGKALWNYPANQAGMVQSQSSVRVTHTLHEVCHWPRVLVFRLNNKQNWNHSVWGRAFNPFCLYWSLYEHCIPKVAINPRRELP